MNKLEALAEEIKACTKCPLREGVNAPVPGFGSITAKYILIGEAPGKNEDREGVPFIGMAGKRLNQLVDISPIDINDCYLTNVCRCRPEGNRNPRKAEIRSCVSYLWREIRLIKPQMVVTLGAIPLSLFSPNGVKSTHGTFLEAEIPDED